MKRISVLIPAAGRGERFGSGANKVFATIAGKPILAHTLSVFESCDAVDEIIIVVGENEIEVADKIVGHFGFTKVRGIIAGGSQRQDSVRNGLAEVTGDIVAIHDGARPMITHKIIIDSISKASEMGACIAAVPVIDTIKSACADGIVKDTIDRSNLYAVQTPQTFRVDLIRKAYEHAYAQDFYATDDAALVERLGEKVAIVQGSYDNIKITTPSDVDLACAKLGGGETRTGIGFDVHAFAENRKLVLGGVEIEHEKGLLGHSDADVMLHAIADACLGAAALGDIGKHFPDTDPQYKGISSLKLLSHVTDLISKEGWKVVNIDAVLACEKPKISSHVPEMVRKISESLRTDPSRVSVKGTTTERLGFTGRGEGIACYAIAVLSNS